MNEKTPERQLTRRELRELAAQRAAQTTGEYTDTATTGFAVHAEPGYTEEQLQIVAELTAQVQVSRVTTDGRELTRREYRAAREAEYQRLLTAWEADNGPLTGYGVAAEAVVDAVPQDLEHTAQDAGTAVPAAQEVTAEATAPAETAAAAEAAAAVTADTNETVAQQTPVCDAELPATQAFSVAELAEAAGETGDSEEPSAKKRLWPWGKKEKEQQSAAAVDATVAEAEAEAEVAAAVVADVTGANVVDAAATAADAVDERAECAEDAAAASETQDNAESSAQQLVEAELVSDPEPEVTVFTTENEVIVPAVEEAQVAAEAEIVAGNAAPAEEAAATAVATEPEPVEYSFPDIAPLDEEVSVFDADSGRELSASTGFDALINRAVEEETSASVTSGTAALILPTLPEEAVLAAALDEESGVFVSGSIQLPQSVGETGGHHSLHGSDAGEKEVLDEIFETSSHTQPVSALRAVSSQHAQVTQMLTETKKDDSKAPLVFMITGGALVVAAGAVVIAALNGMFG